MIPFAALPALNAVLNAASAAFLAVGFAAIRRRRVRVHRTCMLAAFAASTVFLASYVTYHAHAGTTRFAGGGWARPVYLVILGTHTALAALIPPLAIVTLSLAFRARFARHARLARWTLPVWFYVSLTGVVIYLMLYRLYPAAVPRAAVATAAAQATPANAAATPSESATDGKAAVEAGSRHARSAASP